MTDALTERGGGDTNLIPNTHGLGEWSTFGLRSGLLQPLGAGGEFSVTFFESQMQLNFRIKDFQPPCEPCSRPSLTARLEFPPSAPSPALSSNHGPLSTC
jgi:hypothetical protein